MTPAGRVVVPLQQHQQDPLTMFATVKKSQLAALEAAYSALLVENERLEDEVHHHESERRRLHGLLAQGIALRGRVEGVKVSLEALGNGQGLIRLDVASVAKRTAFREAARLLTSALEGK